MSFINPENFKDLAAIYEHLKPLAEPARDADLYVDGELIVRHKDGYVLGRFYLEDEWWMYQSGSEEELKATDG